MRRNFVDCPSDFFAQVCHDPFTMAAASLALTAGSTLVGVVGASQQADAAKADAGFKAKQLEQKGNEERAAGQRQMFQEQRQKDLAQSQLQTRAAASGGGATDNTVLDIAGDMEREGELQAATQFYKGENAARGFADSAAATRATGKAQAQGYRLKGFGTLLEGASSFADKYNKLPAPSKAYG